MRTEVKGLWVRSTASPSCLILCASPAPTGRRGAAKVTPLSEATPIQASAAAPPGGGERSRAPQIRAALKLEEYRPVPPHPSCGDLVWGRFPSTTFHISWHPGGRGRPWAEAWRLAGSRRGQRAVWQECREQGWPRGDREGGAHSGGWRPPGSNARTAGHLDGLKDGSGCREGSGRITLFGKVIGLSS